MILEIRLANFFSIKDEITLDFRTANLRSKKARELSDNIFHYKDISVLKTLALYGANASGKSNIIKAVRFCVSMVINSHNHNENTIFNFKPFKFDGYPEKSSKFFIRFVHNNIEYEYSFELTRTEIIKEALYFYPKGRITKIFERDEIKGNTKNEKYSFGKFIKKPMDVAESTSVKTLFISRASQMDREIPKQIFSYFNEHFILGILAPDDIRIEYYFTNYKEDLLEALQIADSDIIDIGIEKNVVPVTKVELKKGDSELPTTSISSNIEMKISIISYHRKNSNLKFNFLLEESDGTRQLFFLLLTIFDIVKNDKAILIDELDIHLHPHIVQFILKLFNKSNSAQLLFTTHNTFLLDLNKFRKDQIYFCNKRDDASTEVYSLYDFSDFRDTMDVEKAYLNGRFDAIPYLNDSNEKLEQLLNE
jgi:AAA15 family ATPase/GTPase